MASPEGIYHGTVRVFSVVFIAIGVVVLAVTLGAGGGPLSIGFLMGAAFIAVGAGRLWATSRMRR